MTKQAIPSDGPEAARFDLLGLDVSATTPEKVISALLDWAKDGVGHYVCFREVPSLMAMRDDPVLTDASDSADLIVPDGMPLVWFARGLGHESARVNGPNLMHQICVQNGGMGLKHFLYGGNEGVAEKLAETLRAQASDLQIVGTYCPPFRPLTPDESAQVVEMISESEADLVWVGISSPKQDLWMRQHAPSLTQTLLGVGAAFDLLSGEVRRAPRWMQERGLESVYRLAMEPRRLWRRYLVLVPKFLILLAARGQLVTLLRGAFGSK